MYHVGIDERHEHESPANSRYDGLLVYLSVEHMQASEGLFNH